MKVTFRFKVIVNGENVDDWGLGPGVLYTEDRAMEIDDREELESWPVRNAIMSREREVIDLVVRCEVTEVTE